MKDIINQLIKHKKVLILGFGREGKSSFHYFKKLATYSQLDIADVLDTRPDISIEHNYIGGSSYLDCLEDYDIVIKSPGIVLPKHANEYSCMIRSQTDLFLQAYRLQCIGITGTKGKSTTSTLLYHILKQAGVDCLLAGNIGIPVFDIEDSIKENTCIILELSCHQLEYTKFAPSTSILLNIYEDHLDHYGCFSKYERAKQNIYLYQQKGDLLYCSEQAKPREGTCPSQVIEVTDSILPFHRLKDLADVKLRGLHNKLNCAFVYHICQRYHISDSDFVSYLCSYEPLPHRLQFVGTVDHIDYYDDSISTTVESAIQAVESIENASILLLGGMDRGIDYSELIEYLKSSKLDYVLFMYESGLKMYECIKNFESSTSSYLYFANLHESIAWVKQHAGKGTACILSPASASYTDFKNFEERGRVFQSLVIEI